MAKKIEAIIREEKLADVKDALRAIGIVGMNIFEVKGHGRQGGITLAGRSGTYKIDMLPRVQVNVILSDHNVEKTIETIRQAAKSEDGGAGDGLIFIFPVDDVVRIRTGERGADALKYEGDIDAKLAKYYAPPASKRGEESVEEGKVPKPPGRISRFFIKS